MHTHMVRDWRVDEPFQFFVQKTAGKRFEDDRCSLITFTTDELNRWRHSATIASPNGDEKSQRSVSTIGGGGGGLLSGKLQRQRSRATETGPLSALAWNKRRQLKVPEPGQGDGVWGQLRDTYFLAEGSEQEREATFDKLQGRLGMLVFGKTQNEALADFRQAFAGRGR